MYADRKNTIVCKEHCHVNRQLSTRISVSKRIVVQRTEVAAVLHGRKVAVFISLHN